jgi:hypothetical protein
MLKMTLENECSCKIFKMLSWNQYATLFKNYLNGRMQACMPKENGFMLASSGLGMRINY